MKVTQWDLFCQHHQHNEELRPLIHLEVPSPSIRLALLVEGELNTYEASHDPSELTWGQLADQWDVCTDISTPTAKLTFIAYGDTVKEARRNLRRQVGRAITIWGLEKEVFGRTKWWQR